MIKMILQPLVENAIYHGIKMDRKKGEIRITGSERNGSVYFTVSDTGPGLTEDKLNALNHDTLVELKQAVLAANESAAVDVIVITGAGEKAFCTGGDQSIRDKEGYRGTIAAMPLERCAPRSIGTRSTG